MRWLLNKQPDGTFGLTADLWNGHVEKEVGQGYGKLLQLYGVHKATIEARKKGLSVLLETAVEKCGGWRSNSAAPGGSKLVWG